MCDHVCEQLNFPISVLHIEQKMAHSTEERKKSSLKNCGSRVKVKKDLHLITFILANTDP